MKFGAIACLSVFAGSTFARSLVDFRIQDPAALEGILNFPGRDDGTEPVPGDSPFTVCDLQEEVLLTIDHINIEPNPPVKGENLSIEASGFLKEQIDEGAYVEVDVRYGYIRLVHQTFDLCEQISNVDMQCPLKQGNQTIKKTVELPKEIPPGKYLVNARAYTKDDKEITCLSATVEFPMEL